MEENMAAEQSEDLEEQFDLDLFAEEEEPGGLFEDATEAEQTGESEETAEGGEQSDEEQKPNTELVTIPFNGQEIQVTKEQAAQLVQRSVAYEQQKREMEQLRNSPERTILQEMAMQAGVPYEQFLQTFTQNIQAQQIQTRAAQLAQEKFLDEDTALQLAKLEIENQKLSSQQQMTISRQQEIQRQIQMEQQAKAQKQQAFIQEIGALCQQYPDFQTKYPTLDKMPQEMQQAIQSGGSITAAYQSILLKEKDNEIAMLKQNQTNVQRAPGSAAGNGSNDTDAFLNALWSDD